MQDLFAWLRQFSKRARHQFPTTTLVQLRGPCRTFLIRKQQRLTQRARRLLELFGSQVLRTKTLYERERHERVLRHVKRHRERRIAFDKRMRGELGVRVALGPILETFEVEVLILKRMSKFMGHHWLLAFEFDPVSQVKLLHFRIVV